MKRLAPIVYLLAMIPLGCGRANPLPTAAEADDNILLQVGEMYRSYQTAKSRPPVRFADLGPMRAISGNAYQAVQRGDVILRYDATMSDLREEPGPPSSEEVLAYQKDVPEKGGKVLMLDRNIRSMTPDEFKAAKMAGKEAQAK